MKCKKCRKQIPDKSKFCNHCGAKQENQKMYRRSDGLYEKIITVNGKRKAFRGKTEKEVTKKILEYNEEKEKGRLFSEVADEWYNEHFPTLAYSSQKSYNQAFKELKEEFGNRYIKDIRPTEADRFIKNLPKSMAKKTCKTRLLVMNMIFKYAVTHEEIENNPALYVQVPKWHSETSRRSPTEKEIEIVKKNVNLICNDFNVGLYAFFLLYTGLRKGEALALQYKDINRETKRIKVYKSVYYESTKPVIKEPKTQKSNRSVILPDTLLAVLPKGKLNDFVFSNANNKKEPLNGSNYDYAWDKYRKLTGLTELSAHMLRHGYASVLFDADIKPKDAQDLLGHADIQTTYNRYTHISETHKKSVEEKLNKFIENTENSQLLQ